MIQSPGTTTWLITGAQGFLGANLGQFLEGRVNRIGTARAAAVSPQFDEMLCLDLSRLDEIQEGVRRAQPDVVVHAAALSSHEACENDPDLARLINVEVTDRLAQSAEYVGARFILISTDAVFDGKRGNYREDDEVSPFSVYGETKLLGERRAIEATDALVLRTNFFGWSPTGTRSILEFFVNSLTKNLSVQGFNDYIVSSIYVQDLIQVLWDLDTESASGIYHCVASNALSKFDFGVAVAHQFGLDSRLIQSASSPAGANGISRIRNLSLDTKKAARLLGHPLATQESGLQHAFGDRSLLRNEILS